MTKEEKKEYSRKWYLKNKVKVLAMVKEYNAKHKEEKVAYNKAYKESKKDGLHTVYYLPKENYVGMTTGMYNRLNQHKTRHKRDITDVEIFGRYETDAEARGIERELHSLGYLGNATGRPKKHRI
tara:strand:- start:63 stop:437 length:375 start_codon:yes stop_codon:yes gene_type:complete